MSVLGEKVPIGIGSTEYVLGLYLPGQFYTYHLDDRDKPEVIKKEMKILIISSMNWYRIKRLLQRLFHYITTSCVPIRISQFCTHWFDGTQCTIHNSSIVENTV